MQTIQKLKNQYFRQISIIDNNAPGPKVDRAQDRIETICQKAEEAGVINEFLVEIGINSR